MKTYIFVIGGTGARVLKSLIMLMSAGVEINTDEIVPVFIDPDAAAANLTEAKTLLDDYRIINEHLSFTGSTNNKFFHPRITELVPQYRLNLANTQTIDFDSTWDLMPWILQTKPWLTCYFLKTI